jgi:DNA primase
MVALADRTGSHRSDKFAEPEAEASLVEEGWGHAFALHQAQVGLKEALALAERDWQAEPTEAAWRRIVEIQQRLAREATFEGEA